MYKLNGRSLEFTYGELKDGECPIYLNGSLTKYTLSTDGEFISYAGKNGYHRRALSMFPDPECKRLKGNIMVHKVRHCFDLDRLMIEAFFINEAVDGKKVLYDRGKVEFKDGNFYNLNRENLIFLSDDGIKITFEGGVKKIEKKHII